jgi:RHS repeat-associated protein
MSFALDPDQNRIASFTDNGTTTINHYTGDSDSPAWSASGSTWTRNFTGPDGNLAAVADQTGTVTLELTNPHGDVVATSADSASATMDGYVESTEYGLSRDPSSTMLTNYGWLGGKQRSSDDLAGFTLMGVRLYNPATGRFLSVDPVPGGNANTYTCPTDPINGLDLDGRRCSINPFSHNSCVKIVGKKIVHTASRAIKKVTVFVKKHVLNREFWDGVDFALEALGAVGLGVTIILATASGVGLAVVLVGAVSGIIIASAGGSALGYVSYKDFNEAFAKRHREE